MLIRWITLTLAGLVFSTAEVQAISGQLAAPAVQYATPHPAPLVVLVHGMGRTSLSMIPLEIYLEHAGYRVLNFQYSSYGPSVAEISDDLARSLGLELEQEPATAVHFVGHSLGNVVVRHFLTGEGGTVASGRVVMLAPPNGGSRAADRYAPYVDGLLSPISELRTDDGTAAKLPLLPPSVEFAIIAGEWDSRVSFEEACLPGAKAFAVVPSGHTFIVMRPRVLRMVKQFLGAGELSDSSFLEALPCVRE